MNACRNKPGKESPFEFSPPWDLERNGKDICCLLVRNCPDTMLVADIETRQIMFINPAGLNLLGYDAQTISKMKIDQIHPADQLPRILEQFQKSARGEITLITNIPILTRNGSIVYVDIQEIPIEILGQKCVLGSFRDVTNRHAIEEELRKSEDRFRLAIHAAPVGILMYALEPDNRLVFEGSNAAADAILKIENEHNIGKTIEEAFPPLANTPVPDAYRRVAREGGVWSDEQLSYKDARIEGAFEVTAFQIKPGHMAAMFRDVTERKKNEEELRKYSAALREAAESVVITDAQCRIIYANPCFEKMTGYTLEEVKNEPIGSLKSGKHDDAFYQEMWHELHAGRTWHGLFINRRKDGTLFEEEAAISPVRDTSGKVANYVAVKRDVSRERDLERRMIRSQKMAALGTLAYRVAHDMANHLSVVMGNTEMLRKKATDISTLEAAQGVLNGVERMASFTAQLMAFSHPGNINARRTDMGVLIRGLEEMLQRIGGENIQFNFVLEKNCMVNVDEGLMEQAIIHVVANSFEAMPNGGRILITLRRGTMAPPLEEAPLSNGTGRPTEKEIPACILEITDTGCGIPPEDLTRVFEPFFTSQKKDRRHIGLGLATAYTILNKHNGEISIDSRMSQGTTVHMLLPLLPS